MSEGSARQTGSRGNNLEPRIDTERLWGTNETEVSSGLELENTELKEASQQIARCGRDRDDDKLSNSRPATYTASTHLSTRGSTYASAALIMKNYISAASQPDSQR